MEDSGEGEMGRMVSIKVEMLTADVFEPFGEVMSMTGREPDYRGISSLGWRAAYDADGPSEVLVYSSRYSGLRFSVLERHVAVTQAFIPLRGVPSVVAVAAPTEGDGIPEPEDVRAFLLDGSAGYVLRRGAWHSPDRYPLYPPSSEIVIITSRATQTELETAPRDSWKLTRMVDYAVERGITFEIVL
ncbi:MAG TPA: ureidoglycolate lyase [Thermomicrobiales bacterium]|nr:ureidoglycolate lyase [Thermomicrobiales bacterium]